MAFQVPKYSAEKKSRVRAENFDQDRVRAKKWVGRVSAKKVGGRSGRARKTLWMGGLAASRAQHWVSAREGGVAYLGVGRL